MRVDCYSADQACLFGQFRGAQQRTAAVTTARQRQMFARALQQARTDYGLSQRALAVAVGVSQAAVSQWLLGQASPNPERVAALEEALHLEPQSLARLLGQLPYGEEELRPRMTVVEAAEADPRLGERDRRILAAVYRELVRQGQAGEDQQTPRG
jgi:transcriptional regulator with XRE-family HTH domain